MPVQPTQAVDRQGETVVWKPSGAQWTVIWGTFAVAVVCWVFPDGGLWFFSGFNSFEMSYEAFEALRWLLVVGGALGVWWLEGAKRGQ